MEKPVAVIELGSKSVKLVIGYVLDNQVYVLYTLTKNIGAVIDQGTITDPATLLSALKDISVIQDSDAKLRIKISDAIVVLPPYGLEVLQTTQTTSVISEGGKIGSTELKNVYAITRMLVTPTTSNTLIDIIPVRYDLSEGRRYTYPPLGHASNTLTIKVRLHTLPKRIVNDYRNIINDSGISIRRFVTAPQGAIDLLASYGNDVPSDYVLVDIGSKITTVSLVGAKELYSSRFFKWGGDNITDKIVEKFNVSEEEAEKYKILYGLDKREYSFDAPICTSDDGYGNTVQHTVKELNAIIKDELDNLARELNIAIDHLLDEGNDGAYKKLPMILIGGGSLLTGLTSYIEPKVPSETVRIVTPKSMGARNPSYFNTLGMVLSNFKYPNVSDEGTPKVNNLTRDPIKEDK